MGRGSGGPLLEAAVLAPPHGKGGAGPLRRSDRRREGIAAFPLPVALDAPVGEDGDPRLRRAAE